MIEPLKDANGSQIGMQTQPESHEERQEITDFRQLRRWAVQALKDVRKECELRLLAMKKDLLLMERLVDHCVEVVGQMRLVVEAPRAPNPPTGLERIFKVREEARDYE